MTSWRKKLQGHAASPDKDAPATASTPIAAAKLPDPIVEPQPAEQPVESDPVATAASSAIRDRLREMQRAESFVGQALQQYAVESQQVPEVPAPVQKWLAEHPHYLDPRDAVAQAELQLATARCIRDGKTWHDPDFIERIEHHLGLGQQAQPQPAPAHTNGNASQQAVQRQREPARQQQYIGPPVSAPVRRDPPSMSTGRPQSEPARLTSEEAQLARSLGLSVEEYSAQKRKMHDLKAAGVIVDGR